MWVKQLIGRLAGSIVDLPFSAAESAIANGTAVAATDEEVIAAGFEVVPVQAPVALDVMPIGYRAEPTEAGGFDLYDAAGVRLNEDPIPNMAAVLSGAHDHVAATVLPAANLPLVAVPPLGNDTAISLADYRFEPAEGGGFVIFDAAGVPFAGEPIPDEEAAHLAIRQHYAAARGLTLDELEAEEAEAARRNAVQVPDGWRDLHHTQRRALARQISGRDPVNTAAADETIEEYLTRP